MEHNEATRHLIRDHRAILHLLASLERAAQPLDPAAIARDLGALEELLVRHRRKEETVFFPVLAGRDEKARAALVRASHDHALEEAFVEEVKALVEVARKNAECSGPLPGAVEAMITFYRRHLAEEERQLFPQADLALSPSEQKELADRMSAVEVSV